MIAHSTRSRARHLAGAALATILVGTGLSLTASGGIAAPSRIAPATLKPLLKPAPVAQPQLAEAASDDADAPAAAPTKAASWQANVQPTPPAAPAAPVAVPARFEVNLAAAAAAPVPPAPPVPPVAPTGAAWNVQIDAAKQAGEDARRAIANIDFAAISRDAVAQARAELERSCKHAAPAPAGESDQAAIARLSAGCFDRAAIQRQVQDALREASEEIRRDKDLSEVDRTRALAAIERSRAEMAQKFAQ